jgi:hypothetical protein
VLTGSISPRSRPGSNFDEESERWLWWVGVRHRSRNDAVRYRGGHGVLFELEDMRLSEQGVVRCSFTGQASHRGSECLAGWSDAFVRDGTEWVNLWHVPAGSDTSGIV